MKEYRYDKASQTLLFEDFKIYERMRVEHRLCAEAIGTLISNSSQNDMLGPPFVLNFLQTLYALSNGKYTFIKFLIGVIKHEQLHGAEDIEADSVTINPHQTLKLKVFEDLTKNKGYYITEGIKFGADFLAYQGDPNLYHAKYLVNVNYTHGNVAILDLLGGQRLANTSKKVLLIAFEKGEMIDYLEVSY